MGSKSSRRAVKLPPPYLKRIALDASKVADKSAYPFCLPLFARGFELSLDRAITVIVGENGTGKSTLLECMAELAGFGRDGGSRDHRLGSEPSLEASGDKLADVFRASWLPKIGTGWFFRAESFFSMARYMDRAALDDPFGGPPPDFLSHSHGEGFLRFFEERCQRQGLFLFDEPESALSPTRQIEFLKLLKRMDDSQMCQVVIATHSPILMAYPNARLMQVSKHGIEPTTLENTPHFRLWREFFIDPRTFLESMMQG